jgi:hypothetical protein
MPTELSCGCGKRLRIADEAVGKKVRCPACQAILTAPTRAVGPAFEVVESEPGPAPHKPARAAVDDEDERPRRKNRPRDEEDEEPPPKKRVRKGLARGASCREEVERKPFWKTRAGLILNGLGLIALGVGGIALYFLADGAKKLGLVIACVLCIGFGIGGIITGVTQSSAGEEDGDDNSEGADDS